LKKRILAGAIAIAMGGAIFASPYFALHQIKQSLRERDADSLSERVDFPALRENLKGQLMAAMTEGMSAPAMKELPFAAMGQALGAALIGPMVDSMISPAGVELLMRNNAAISTEARHPAGETSAPQSSAGYTLSYKGWSKVVIHATNANGNEGDLTLRRHGLWSWKLAAIEMSAGALARH
jgi:hypothetical protein